MNIREYQHGIFPQSGDLILNMPDDIYHTWPGSISKSGLHVIQEQSPAHFRYAEPRDRSRAMEIGSALHCAVLQPDLFAARYLCLRDTKARTASEYKSACKDWPGGGEFVLTGPEADHISGMQSVLYSDPNTRTLLESDGYREASLFVTDPDTGCMLRVRFDLLTTDGQILDLKKTRDCRPRAFMAAITSYGYDMQAAFYLHAGKLAGLAESFTFLAIEESMPHARKLYLPDADVMQRGAVRFREALETYAQCIRTDFWPCYPSQPEYIGLPGWALDETEISTEDSGE
jgi:exodeoxyribonuclease VIII